MKYEAILEKINRSNKLENQLETVYRFDPLEYSKIIKEDFVDKLNTTKKVSDILPGKLVTFKYNKPNSEDYDKYPLCIVLSRNSTFFTCINLNYLPLEARKYFLGKYIDFFKNRITKEEDMDRLEQRKLDIEVNSILKSFAKIGVKISIKNYRYTSIKDLIIFKYQEIPIMSIYLNPLSRLSYKTVLKNWLNYMKENSNK